MSVDRLSGQVEHTVGDHHVDAAGGQRDLLDVTPEELDVGSARLGGVGPGEGEHLLGHVQAVGLALRSDPAGGEQHVDAAAGAEVEHHLAFPQVGDRERVAATEAG